MSNKKMEFTAKHELEGFEDVGYLLKSDIKVT